MFASLLALVAPALACGPWLAHALTIDSDEALWAAPVGDFARHLGDLVEVKEADASTDVLDAEEAELRAILPASEADAFVAAWRAWRTLERPDPPVASVALPADFVAYARAAVAYRGGALDPTSFQALVGSPTRGAWARFMLARLADDEAAHREVIAHTGDDPLGLVAFSWGEIGRYAFTDGRWRPAVDAYLAQLAAGGDGAVDSLRIVVSTAVRRGALDAWAEDPVLRELATAWFVSHASVLPSADEVARTRAWLDAVERADAASLAEGDHLAWMAYQVGDVGLAERWISRAERTPLAIWLSAKLALRAGRPEAEALLAEAAAAFPADEAWADGGIGAREPLGSGVAPRREAWAELGVVRLGRGDFVGALDAFVAAGSWPDAAYVAERVLTTSELRRWVDAHRPEPIAPGEVAVDGWRAWESEHEAPLRYLLGRRMLRDGAGAEALAYLPPELREAGRRYVDGRSSGRNLWLSREARAGALWDAGIVARAQGLELLGTELEPDFAIYLGDFDRTPRVEDRLPRATEAERARVEASAPAPDQRWHYRKVASELLREAAGLLEDDDPRLPMVLCRAGSWHLDRDPAYARGFYREAARRTGSWPEACGEPTFGSGVNVAAIGVVGAASLALLGLLGRLLLRR